MTISIIRTPDGELSVMRLTSQELANLALQAHQDARRMVDDALMSEALRLADMSARKDRNDR